MIDAAQIRIFLPAAAVLAALPGPGMLYVLARSLRGGRSEGFASSLGTAAGGMVHVVAGALGRYMRDRGFDTEELVLKAIVPA